MSKLPTARELIAKIIPNRANFDYCGQSGKINGSLLMEIEKAIESHTATHTKELGEENATLEKYNSLLIEEKRILGGQVSELKELLYQVVYEYEQGQQSFKTILEIEKALEK